MGAVAADVVIATFYNFNPALVAAAIPDAWDVAAPATVLEARYDAADVALCELLGGEVLGSAEMGEAAGLARRAAEACPLEGRPLFAGHAGLDWPGSAHMVLWHAVTLLREFRGDGHVAALTLAGVDGCEALVTHGAASDGVTPQVLRSSRAWPADDWRAAEDRLRARGWLDGDGELTPDGRAGRDRIEALTDESALAPWRAIGDEACDRLRVLVRPWSRTIVASGVFSGA
jgi:hypothetical protein